MLYQGLPAWEAFGAALISLTATVALAVQLMTP